MSGKWHVWVGYPDKRASERLGDMLEEISSRAAMGLPLDKACNDWVQGIDIHRQAMLSSAGLIHAESISSRIGIDQHLDDYDASLATTCTEKHRKLTMNYLRAIVSFAGWASIHDISADPVNRYISELQSAELGKVSSRTIQYRVGAAKSFSRWLSRNGKLSRDPLTMIRRPRHVQKTSRRMLLPEEWAVLSQETLRSPIVRGLTGEERQTLYLTAIQTGFRANELRSLRIADLILDGDRPYILLGSRSTKNRKSARQFIRPALARTLNARLSKKRASAPVFDLPQHFRFADSLASDLARARSAWLEAVEGDPAQARKRMESDFLLRVNHAGEVLDFHALRHTCGAWLASQGAHPKAIQAVMRHSTIMLTMDTYGHLFPDQEFETVSLFDNIIERSIEREPGTGT